MSAAAALPEHGDLTRFEATLRAQIQADPRLASGAPSRFRGDELDFIRLTGMTRPAALESAALLPPPPSQGSAAARGFREIIEMLGGTPAEEFRESEDAMKPV